MYRFRLPSRNDITQSLIWVGVGISLLYWFLESWIHVVIFKEGSLVPHIFTPDPHELWKRFLVISLLIVFSIYAQRSINIRQRTENALALALGEMDQIFQTASVGMRVIGRDFNILKVNKTFETITGVPAGQAFGKKCYEIFAGPKCSTLDCPFIRSDYFATPYSMSPNWAAGRNGNDRYNFYVRRSFDGGRTWTTTPAALGGEGIHYCREWRSDPTVPDDDGSGNAPPVFDGFDPECVAWCAPEDLECVVRGEPIAAGTFEPGRNVSKIDNNKESSGDPRIGTTPPTYPLDGRDGRLPILRFVEDEYVNNMFFVAWGTVDKPKSTGFEGVKPEGAPLDLYYTRSEDYGDTYLKIPWVSGGVNSNEGYGEIVWRYDFMAKGDPEEQGECQLRATSDGSKMYAIYHSAIAEVEDPEEIYTRWYPWKPEVSYENDFWFRRVIFWPDAVDPQ